MSMLWELDALKQMAKQPTVPGLALDTALREIDALKEVLVTWTAMYKADTESLRAEYAAAIAERDAAREALHNLNLSVALFMRLEDNEDEDKAWAALQSLSTAMSEASALYAPNQEANG
jgi:hypothetical protein